MPFRRDSIEEELERELERPVAAAYARMDISRDHA
jgi:hypothetical protein